VAAVKERPPQGDAHERQPHGAGFVRDPEALRRRDHRQVGGEQQPAAQVAEPEAGHRDAVDLVGLRDRRQERVVEGEARGDRDVADDEDRECERPALGAREVERGGRGDADRDERGQEALLAPAQVGDRAQDRAAQADQDHRDRAREREARAGGRVGDAGRGGELDEEIREHGRHYRGHPGGVGHIVERPRALLAALESHPAKEVRHGRQAYSN
jgi:hypothetical protein